MFHADLTQRAFRFVRAIGTVCFDWLVTRVPRQPRGGVVVVKLDAIGDFLLWVNSGEAIRNLYPDQKITLVANQAWAALAEKLPYWDAVLGVEVRRFTVDLAYRGRLLRKLRRAGFRLALQPTQSRHFLTGDPVIRATGAPERIGSEGDLSIMLPWEKRIADRWYTQLLPAGAAVKTEIERHAAFISHLSGTPMDVTLPRLPAFESVSAPRGIPDRYFVVFPGASWIGRQWPIEHFAALIDAVRADTGLQPVLCGGPSESTLCASVSALCATPALNLAGKTSLIEFAELTRHSEFLVGNETSCIHLAAAVGTPSVCIIGGGHFGRFLPYPAFPQAHNPVVVYQKMPCYGCNWSCNQPHEPGGPVPCISQISVNAVFRAIRNLPSYMAQSRC